MQGWETYRLEDLTIDGKGHYGIGAPAVDYDVNKLTYLRITDINDDGSLNYSGLKSVDAPEAHKYLLREGDIVFARTGNSTGRSYFYEPSDGQFVFAGFLIKFSIDPAKVNPRFLKYYTHSKPYYEWVQSFDTGATRGNINAQTYGSMEINLPPREVQDRLVDILSSIDDKIKLNNRINHNLEEQAQALYKSWFVDFEPFKGGKFVDSELGMIPEGWRVGTLSELLEVRYGKDHKALKDGTIPVFGSGGLMRYVERALFEGESVLIPRKGTLNNVIYVNGAFWTVDTLFYTVERASNAIKYCHLFLLTQDLASMNAGSAVPSMTTDILNNLPLLVPPYQVLNDFNRVLSSIYDVRSQREEESNSLSQSRDTILPQLMTGALTNTQLNC